MNQEQKLAELSQTVDHLWFFHLREQCRLTAVLEVFAPIAGEQDPKLVAALLEHLDRRTEQLLQKRLEEWEKANPGFAARIDIRTADMVAKAVESPPPRGDEPTPPQ
jgi:hypothetical protein